MSHPTESPNPRHLTPGQYPGSDSMPEETALAASDFRAANPHAERARRARQNRAAIAEQAARRATETPAEREAADAAVFARLEGYEPFAAYDRAKAARDAARAAEDAASAPTADELALLGLVERPACDDCNDTGEVHRYGRRYAEPCPTCARRDAEARAEARLP